MDILSPAAKRASSLTTSNAGGTDGSFSRQWREYVAGGGASILAITVTFPINKAMFRQQVYNVSPAAAARQLWKEGAVNIYRGLPSPLAMKTLSSSVMFGSYAQYSRRLQATSLPLTRSQCKLAGAALAGASEATLMPLERVQVLMQDAKYHERFRNTPHALWTLRTYGVGEYYRGLTAILARNCLGNMIFFSQREKIHYYAGDAGLFSTHLADFIGEMSQYDENVQCDHYSGGAFLGAFISTAFYPLNVTKTHMQLKIGGDFLRLRGVFGQLVRERGWRGMFRGVHINYTRSFLSWGIINVAYENILGTLESL